MSFDSESKLAITWLIPSVNLVLIFIAPVIKDVRIYLLVLFLTLCLKFFVSLESRPKTTTLKNSSTLALTTIYAWFIYSKLFSYHSYKDIEKIPPVETTVSVVHIILVVISNIFNGNPVIKAAFITNLGLICAVQFNLTHDYSVDHIYTQIILFILLWYSEMILSTLMDKDIPCIGMFNTSLPILRSHKVIMGVYAIIMLSLRSWQFVYKDMNELKKNTIIKGDEEDPPPPPIQQTNEKEEEKEATEPQMKEMPQMEEREESKPNKQKKIIRGRKVSRPVRPSSLPMAQNYKKKEKLQNKKLHTDKKGTKTISGIKL